MRFLFSLFLISLAGVTYAQCLQVTTGSYAGITENGSLDKYGSGNFTIEQLENGDLYFHDFSAGFISEFGFDPISLTISMDCQGNIQSKEFQSKFGIITITSGKLNAESSVIVLEWKIPVNHVDEKSTFTLNQ